MIDNPDFSTSTLRLLVWQALRNYSSASLLPMLEDEDFVVRTAVARELQVRGERESFEYTLRLCDDHRVFVREIAAFAVGQFGTPAYPFRSESIPKLEELAVGDSSPDVRAAAVAGLGHLHARESKEILLRAADDIDPDVRANAAVSLGRLGNSPDIVQMLQKLLVDSNKEVREWAELGVELAQNAKRSDPSTSS